MEEPTIIEALRDARVAVGFSRWDVARKLGISPQKLHRIEEGQKTDLPETFAAEYRQALRDLDHARTERLEERLPAGIGGS